MKECGIADLCYGVWDINGCQTAALKECAASDSLKPGRKLYCCKSRTLSESIILDRLTYTAGLKADALKSLTGIECSGLDRLNVFTDRYRRYADILIRDRGIIESRVVDLPDIISLAVVGDRIGDSDSTGIAGIPFVQTGSVS